MYLSFMHSFDTKIERGSITAAKMQLETNITHAELNFSIVKFSINVLRIKAGTKTVFSSFAKIFEDSSPNALHFTNTYPKTISKNKKII